MKVHIIYLAAGNSRRFGTENKLLYQFQGKPLYLHGLEMLHTLVKKKENLTLTVVTQYEEIAEEVRKRGICTAFSKECKNGISYSIQCGIQNIPDRKPEDYFLFVVADQPFLKERTVERLLLCTQERIETASVRWKETPGNPTLFSAKLEEELLALSGDRGGRAVIRKHNCYYVDLDEEKEMWDLDEKSDAR